MKPRCFLAIAISALIIASLFTPVRSSAQNIHEKVEIELVNLYMSAMDSKGHFITDLKQEDLVVKEQGVPQAITHFTNFSLQESHKLGEPDVPLTVALNIDVSESMNARISTTQKIDIVKNAAVRVVSELGPDDQMTLIAFNDMSSELMSLTSEKKQIEEELLFVGVKGGNTALIDSIYFAVEKIKNAPGRKIIVVCSDGEDTASYLRFNEVLNNVIASDITILAFGTVGLGSSSLRARYVLEKFAKESGGYAFFPTSLNELDEVMEKLRKGMRSQYSLGYRPTIRTAGNGWRKIEIVCKRAGLKLRYRQGYVR